VSAPGKRPSRLPLEDLWQILTRADKILILAVAMGTFGLFFYQRGQAESGAEVVVQVDGVECGVYPLDRSQILRFAGPLGVSEVEIGGRTARVVTSPCPHQLCVRQGRVRRRGEVIVCVPNRLVLKLRGGAEPARVDAVVR